MVKIINPKYELIFEITNLPLNTSNYNGQYEKIIFNTLKVIYENGNYTELKDISTYKINPDQHSRNNFEIFRENFGDPNLVNLMMRSNDRLSTNRMVKHIDYRYMYYFNIKKTDINLLNCNESKPCAIIIRKM